MGRGSSRIVCVANQKGGVAKTTTVVNLGAALALRGHRILVVDVDPQGNATTGLGLDPYTQAVTTYDILMEERALAGAIVPTPTKGLSCVPASQDLAGAEVELVERTDRGLQLRRALARAREGFDIVFLDCPPSLGLLTVNALAAADDVVVPVQCEYYALEGLGHLLGNAERVRAALNHHLRMTGFVLTMYDARTKLSSQVADEVRAHFGDRVFQTVIPRSVRLSEAPSFGEPVITLDPSSRGAVSYRLLATEFEERYGLAVHAPPPPPGSGPVEPGPGGRGYGVPTAQPATAGAWPPASTWDGSVLSERGGE